MSKNLNFLSKISEILIRDLDINELVKDLKLALNDLTELNDINIYVYDNITNTMRDCLNSWSIIEDSSEIYNSFMAIRENDFIINSKAFKLPSVIGDITFKLNELFMPIIKDEKEFGIIKLEFAENTSVNMEFLFLLKILSSQISLKLQ